VSFDIADMTDPSLYAQFGKPDVVVSNPPFEPVPNDPGFPRRPLHSAGGPDGGGPTCTTLHALQRWEHRPQLLQLVLFSLGKEAKGGPEHLLLEAPLRAATAHWNGLLELSELLRPLRLEDYLVLNFRRGTRDAAGWLSGLRSQGYETLHLLFANLYPNAQRTALPRRTQTRWIRHTQTFSEDVCFVWPLGGGDQSRGESGLAEGGLVRDHLSTLIAAKERTMKGERVDLRLDDRRIQRYLREIVCSPTLYGGMRPLFFLELEKPAEDAQEQEVSVLGVYADRTDYRRMPLKDLLGSLRDELGPRVFQMRADVREPTSDDPEFIKTFIDSCGTDDLQSLSTWPACTFQRFAALNGGFEPLAPLQRQFFAHFLSELASAAIREKARSMEILADASFMLGHELKNRFGTLGLQELLRQLRDTRSPALSLAESIDKEIDVLYSVSSLYSVIHKLTDDALPRKWLDHRLRFRWPLSFVGHKLLPSIADAFDRQLRNAIFAVDKREELTLSRVDNDTLVSVARYIQDRPAYFPPFDHTSEDEGPAVAFLAGLSELARNAAKAVLNPGNRQYYKDNYGGLLVDYEIAIDESANTVTVRLWNPLVGQVPHIRSVVNLQRLYGQLGDAVELADPTLTDNYRYRTGGRYLLSTFVFKPTALRFDSGGRA
jgi:hypothetical protein